MGDREREEPSTSILETSAVADQRKTKETVGGGGEMESDAEVGSMGKARHTTHALRPVEGQETSMPTEEPHRATDDDGRITPSRGKHGTKDSVGDREREEPSTAIRETSTVTDRRKIGEAVGGGKELETDTEVGSTEDERDEAHAIRPEKGQGTSMPT